jgi:membrane associated rhomboid family serine protease
MFDRIPIVVKNIIIINVLLWLASQVWPILYPLLSGHYWLSEEFAPWQIITHMFMHDDSSIAHLFFNMYGLFVFGTLLEHTWGPKRFLTYYLISGLGAFALHMGINHFEVQALIERVGQDGLNAVYAEGLDAMRVGKNFVDSDLANLNLGINGSIVGASGCVFGVLLAFGLLFPNMELMLLFPPIPIKAKWFVFGYGAIEVLLAMSNRQGDNVAHFAHIGGMLFGYLILKYWQKRGIRLN